MFKKLIFCLLALLSLASIDAAEQESVQLNSFVKLTDHAVLKPLLQKEFQEEPYFSKVVEIAKRVYEVSPRAIETEGDSKKYGVILCVNPESFAYALKICPGKTILEIGGADGSCSLLFAYAGAKHVYMNDIEPKELAKFERTKAESPEVADRLTSVCCDVFDLLKLHPTLASTVDIVSCSNLIHFFTDKKKDAFFPIVKNVLAPNGRIIITGNGLSFFAAHANPSLTRVTTISLFINDHDMGDYPRKSITLSQSECEKDVDPCEFLKLRLYMKAPELKNQWVVLPEAAKVSAEITNLVKEKLKDEVKLLNEIRFGSVFFHMNTIRCYSPQSLAQLLSSHGFIVNDVFYMSKNGHTLRQPTREDQGNRVGIIATINPPPQ